MEWVFETRMEIDESEVGVELTAIQMQIQTEYDDLVKQIAASFEEKQLEAVKKLVDKTKYYEQMLNEIERKQEGSRD